MTPDIKTLDVTLGVTIPSRHARGRAARLGPALDSVLSAHDYPPQIEQLLAEALVLTALLGSLLKDPNGQLTMQAQTQEGIVDLLVCDYKGGELRGYVRHDPARLADARTPSLNSLFGHGYLAITFDQPATDERYQGIVPLEGASLAEAAQSYFGQSEQIPSIVRLAARKGSDGHWVGGGVLFQHLPEGEVGRERLHTRMDHPDWDHVAALAGSTRADELTDPDLPLEDLVWRLFHEEPEVRVLDTVALTRGCRCNPDYVASVIARFPEDERAAMAGDDGIIRVDCEFCSTSFPIHLA
ncbi:Hsp33 family molecular chaperone HslO [Sphingomonas sp. BN140010]|uniref:Hsp33 family molecular chaperone HslO n=1 Tax=Sphingomonas arvum TaxID=2992113 RepID=A0ABT3JDM8_9SPHN|nr:Hsp33 family molecular chaperone HslO [Sphingomonas sp. BN140010]MCW3797114.1 Hsp33 family molecular chaperone HslO [Sphingomonas sp. BN140010]